MTTNTRKIATLITVLIVGAMMSGCVEEPITPAQDIPVSAPTPKIIFTVTPEVIPTPDPVVIPTPRPTPRPTPKIVTEPIVISCIPNNYYNIVIDQYYIDHKLYKYLEGYAHDKPICKDGLSLYEVTKLEQELINMGCNVTMRYTYPKYTHNRDETQCWLMIEINDKWLAYNPTDCHWMQKGESWESYNLIDLKDIYELENFYMSGEMRNITMNQQGDQSIYYHSDEYNTTDDFLVSYGWWITNEELREIKTRINEITDPGMIKIYNSTREKIIAEEYHT